jgi:RNA-directed DNA polymerase
VHRIRSEQQIQTRETPMLEKILSRENLKSAYHRVVTNKGAGGIDGIEVKDLKPLLWENWATTKELILEGKYQPQAIRRAWIDKPDGGKRKLGIPTVLDRMIQQAISQQLTLVYDRKFSNSSYAYRPGRNAHMAVKQALRYMGGKRDYIICIDLSQFFDRVNHDRLMQRLTEQVHDKRVLSLIRKYLQAGEMSEGLCRKQIEGTPQGGPLSPILSNIVLDELDKELESRGHKFVRYADDISIFVKSMKAAERVYESITIYIESRMKLKVNPKKSCICRPEGLTILGHGFKKYRGGYQCCVSPKSVRRFKDKVKTITRKTSPLTLDERFERLSQLFRGWINYFKLCWMRDMVSSLDNWIRDRLRYCIWKSWKRIRTRIRNLRRLGISITQSIRWGCTRKGGWRICKSQVMHVTVTNERLQQRGYQSLVSIYDGLPAC